MAPTVAARGRHTRGDRRRVVPGVVDPVDLGLLGLFGAAVQPVLDDSGNPSGTLYECVVCGKSYERPDMTASALRGEICLLCLSTDREGRHVLPA